MFELFLLLPYTGALGAVSTITLILIPGFVGGKRKYPMSYMGLDSWLGRAFALGLFMSGVLQVGYMIGLANYYIETMARLSLCIYAIGSVCCTFLAFLPHSKYPHTHNMLTRALFVCALGGAAAFHLLGIGLTQDRLGMMIAFANLAICTYMYVIRKSIFWTEVCGITLLVAWNLHFFVR